METNLIEFFKNHGITKDFTSDEFERLINLLDVKLYKEEEVILDEGSSNDSFYFLVDGIIDVVKRDTESKEYFQISTMEPGVMFGEMSVIAKEAISATIRTKTDCKIVTLDHRAANQESFYIKLLLNSSKIVIDRLRLASEQQARALAEKGREQALRAKLETEMKAAHDVQAAFLPKTNPVVDGYEICGYSKAAKEVGGDFFDYSNVEPDKFAFCLGDVCGKGLPAALLMIDCRTIIKSRTLNRIDPQVEDILSQSNDILCVDTEGNSFVTCFLGILDRKSGAIQYCNAGHNAPQIYRSKTGKFEELGATGIVLGMFEDMPYKQAEVQLDSGDLLVLFSDGIPEAHNCDKELYDMDRLRAVIVQNADKVVDEIQEAILIDVDKFVAEADQYDDMTTLIIKKK